ncbi:hypothetical protein [Nocardia blacklockiae]|uniref:hypothetical protein n=1 Tax=Nocardia blacklockiae TaxID=480036 RepID=UPI001893D7E4|nr:hypothetical protein [Nocardia blacklockiae]MBF6173100.1 hypothetical protein [Nocardia blacklockiae]
MGVTSAAMAAVAAILRIYEGIRMLALADPAPAEFATLHERVRIEYLSDWETALAAIWLHGSAEVVEAAVAVDRTATDLFTKAVHHQIRDWEQFERERLPLRHSFERFLQAARHELRLPEVGASFFWDTDPNRKQADAATPRT